MKKILLLVLLPLYLFSYDCTNFCKDPGEYWKPVSGGISRHNGSCDSKNVGNAGPVDNDCTNFIDRWGSGEDCRGSAKAIITMTAISQTGQWQDSDRVWHDYSYTSYVSDTINPSFECVTCTEPDEPLTVPSGHVMLMDIRTDDSISGACPMYMSEDITACADVGGTPLGEKADCCQIIAGCYGPPPQCTPPKVAQPLGGCACPPDTYEVTMNGEFVTCMPNTDCDPEKGQVMDAGTHVCGCLPGFMADANAMCLPSPGDTNNTPPPGCDPGQFLCHGQCQLNSVPCSETPPDPNDPAGGNGLPCDYPDFSSDLPYQLMASTIVACNESFLMFGDTTATVVYKKEPDCWHGACYYLSKSYTSPDTNNTTPPPSDPTPGENSGSISDGNTTQQLDLNLSNLTGAIDKVNKSVTDNGGKLDKIDASINNQGNRIHDALNNLRIGDNAVRHQVKKSGDQISNVLNSLNNNLGDKMSNNTNAVNNTTAAVGSLGAKLDALKGAFDDKNLSVVVNVENNLSIDLNESNQLLRDLNKTLQIGLWTNPDAVANAMRSHDEDIENSQLIFNNALASFDQTRSDFVSIASGSAPSVVYSGSCSESVSVSFGIFKIDLSSLSALRPYVQFALNFMLLIFTLKLYVVIARDVASYLLGGS